MHKLRLAITSLIKRFAELGIPAPVKLDTLVTQEQLTNQNF